MPRAESSDEPDYEELLIRWRRARLHRYTPEDVERLLIRRFNAYEIPLGSIAWEDYANDEEVDETRIYKLLTITDPKVLDAIYGEVEREHKASDPQEIEQDWRDAFANGEVSYNVLLAQHRHGSRTSIVLEKEGDRLTGFKVYGTSFLLNDLLSALVGVRGMKPGDIEDPGFQFYLECLASNDLI